MKKIIKEKVGYYEKRNKKGELVTFKMGNKDHFIKLSKKKGITYHGATIKGESIK